MNLKRIIVGVLAFTTCLSASGSYEIHQHEPDYYLIHHKIKPMKPYESKNSKVRALVEALNSDDINVRLSHGYRNFEELVNYASKGDGHAAYEVADYIMKHQVNLPYGIDYSLLYFKKAYDLGVMDAGFRLGTLYLSRPMDVALMVNGSKKGISPADLQKDAEKLKEIGVEYILEAAKQGHEGAFIAACNLYVSGYKLEQDVIKAAMCYRNAVEIFDSSLAMGILARLYLEHPKFEGKQFHSEGLELARNAVLKGNTQAMAVLGAQLIQSGAGSSLSDVELGIQLLKKSANSGDDLGLRYLKKYMDDSGRLLR